MYKDILNVSKNSSIFPDYSFLDTFQFDNGKNLPPSYKDFCKELGYGLLCRLFLIYIPQGNHPDSWMIQNEDMKYLFLSYINPPLHAITKVEKGVDLIRRAEPFARSENGDFLFWDTENSLSNGEFPVYFTNFSNGINFAGNSLLEFIKIITSESTFKSVLNFHKRPLNPVFEGF